MGVPVELRDRPAHRLHRAPPLPGRGEGGVLEPARVPVPDAWEVGPYNGPMLGALPGWVVDNVESVRREAEPFRSMTAAERAVMLAAACRSAMRLLRCRSDAHEILDHTDPLPESSCHALARLRRGGLPRAEAGRTFAALTRHEETNDGITNSGEGRRDRPRTAASVRAAGQSRKSPIPQCAQPARK